MWVKNAALNAVSGDLPVAEIVNSNQNKRFRLRGARWTQSSTTASSGGAVGACHLQFGDSSAVLSTLVLGHGSSLSAGIVHEIIDDAGILSAPCIRATFGAGSSAVGPLTVTIWGDEA